MATAAAGSRRCGRSRKPLAPVLDNDANISAGRADLAAALTPQPLKAKRTSPKIRKAETGQASPVADEPMGTPPAQVDAADAPLGKADVATAPASTQKAKRASSKGGKAKGAAPSMADELTELQGMLQRLRLEKEKAEEMVRERDEVIRQKEEEIETKAKQQERLQAELKKMQRVKMFEPTMNLPLVQSLLGKDQEGDDKGKKKKKKKGKGKAGNERKKPAPAYILWCKDQWAEIKKSPDADFKEVSNALGAKWKTLSNEEKQPYEERYRQEKEAYLQVVGQEKREAEAMKLLDEEQMRWTAKELLEQYLKFRQEAEEEDGNSKKAKNKRKKEKDPSKPKQPMPAYFLYSQERRAALAAEKKSVPEIGKITGEEWKGMTEAQKVPYEEVARKQKEEYQKQMEVYKQKKLEENASLEKEEEEQKKILKQEALQLLRKKEKADNIIKKTKEKRQKKQQQNADPNRPKRPASSFLLFSKEARKQLAEERPGVNNATLSALISVKWKDLSGAEKKVWSEKAAQGMAAYKREMEEYTKAHTSASSSPTATA
ncbi:high mobility group B protein 6-like [Triticum dicoccoides]|uniref:high mobility group B protein 6-like n=1 Tax=Triticum dicoccoides TaxID=85692 RepID=UPI00188FD793|nr:high mobility group B protein 6-like [Triticum dicoccoides]